jgi:outer membrane protein assembly factor BamB
VRTISGPITRPRAAPAGPLVVRAKSIFAATTRGDLARVDDPPPDDVHSFKAMWHVVLPYPPEGGPLVGGDTVVVSLGDEGIMAFSAETGDERWRSCLAGRLVSITGNHVWFVDRVGRLSSLDLATGMPGPRIGFRPDIDVSPVPQPLECVAGDSADLGAR